DRFKDNFVQFDASANLELGKLLPKEAGLVIPFYGSISQMISTPEYDPFDMDLRLRDKLDNSSGSARDSIRKNAVDFASIKTIRFTNVHKERMVDKKPQIKDIENMDISYTYSKAEARNPLIEYNNVTKQRGGLGYNFAPQPKFFDRFKPLFKKTKHHWFDLV